MDSAPTWFAVIQARKSRRRYTGRKLTAVQEQELRDFFNENIQGPFANRVRFGLVDYRQERDGGRLGTYGMIRGAKQFIAGAVMEHDGCYEDFGYTMEKNVLAATRMGLGTCWLGASFRKSRFSRALNCRPGEIIPAVTPVGAVTAGKTFFESAVSFAAGSHTRKPWQELFFSADSTTTLDPEEAGLWRYALEAVRLAPSAQNKQPWRIAFNTEHKRFDFYIHGAAQEKKGALGFMPRIDLGIAMCHFELAAQESGSTGSWKILQDRAPQMRGAMYRVSWIENNK